MDVKHSFLQAALAAIRPQGGRALVLFFTVFSILASTNPAAPQGLGGGAFSGFSTDGDKPIQIEADRLEVTDKNSQAVFEGNVKVVQGTTVLTTGKLIVFYVQNKKGKKNDIERLELFGGVHVRSDDNVATSDAGSYNMQTKDVVLTGDVTLSQGQNIAKGCVFKANLETGIAHLESRNCPGGKNSTGRIKMLLTPGSEPKPTQ